jgi:ribosomal protein L11 methyltransferase
MKIWLGVTAEVDPAPQDWSAFAEVFARHGVEGTQELSGPDRLQGFLSPEDHGRLDDLVMDLTQAGAWVVTVHEAEEEDWQEAWQQTFPGMRFGRIYVRPTWVDEPAEPGEIEIVIDPGQAFGTGDHATTRSCLTLMQEMPLEGARVADIGCGTGILTIAADRLGAKSIHAVEIERYAVASAQENLLRNGVGAQVHHGSFFSQAEPDEQFDVVLSNILSAALIALAPEAAERVAPGGLWLVSGVVRGNWMDVREAAESAGFRVEKTLEDGEWVTALLVR